MRQKGYAMSARIDVSLVNHTGYIVSASTFDKVMKTVKAGDEILPEL